MSDDQARVPARRAPAAVGPPALFFCRRQLALIHLEREISDEMHGYFERGYTRAKPFKACRSCSLADSYLQEPHEIVVAASKYIRQQVGAAGSMKKLAQVVYVTTPEAFLSLDDENVAIRKDKHATTRLPLRNLEKTVRFNCLRASPGLVSACVERNAGLCFLTAKGRFQARATGPVRGNVLPGKKKYQVSKNSDASLPIAASFLLGKIANSRKVIERALRADVQSLSAVSASLNETPGQIQACLTADDLMGIEGSAASLHFGVFDHFFLPQREDFRFNERSRRSPLDNMNSVLSFLYTLLTNDVPSALEGVDLDPYVESLHQDHPRRPSLALDLRE